MVTKLKTVEDLEKEFEEKYTHEDNIVDSGTIREEALKHLATMLELPGTDHSNCYPGSECRECLSQSAIDFITEFFNVSKEELEEIRSKLPKPKREF
jgi:hypothetical protein